MGYLGLTPITAQQSYLNIDDISGSFNGVTTSFALLVGGVAPVPFPVTNTCLISVNGVIQEPDDSGSTGFRISGGNIVFSSAPTSGHAFFGVILAGADYVNVGVNFPDGTLGAPSITFSSDTDTGLYRSASGQLSIASNGVAAGTFSSSAFLAVAGSAVTPSISQLSDTNTGIYFPGADQVAISTNGTQRLLIDSSGNISLGSLGGAAGVTNLRGSSYHQFVVANDLYVDTTPSDGEIIFRRNAGASESMRIDGSGRLGLGTSAPKNKIDVSGNIGTIANAGFNANLYYDGGWKYFGTGHGSAIYQASGGWYFSGTSSSGTADAAATVTDWMTITPAGRVGIGTTSPSVKLEVSGATSSNPEIRVVDGTVNTQWYASNNGECIFGTFSNHPQVFRTNGAERVRIDTSGRLLVGTTTARAGLSVALGASTIPAAGASTAAAVFGNELDDGAYGVIIGADASGNGYIQAQRTDGNTTVYTLALQPNGGDVTINKTSTSVTVNGTILANGGQSFFTVPASTGGTNTLHVYSSTASAYRFYVGLNGTVNATNTTISAISDQRLKENIRDLETGLAEILSLQPRRFDWKAGKGKDIQNDQGFIAQEFEQVFPEMIGEWIDPAPEGEEPYKSVRADLIPVLVKAIQEQQAIINGLEARLAALEAS